MWHFNRIAQGCLKCMPMIPVISWQPGHGSLSAHFSPVSSTEDKHLVANFEQVAQTRNDVTATSNPIPSLSCCNATGGQRKGRGAFPHLTEVHADLVKAWKVNSLKEGWDDNKREDGEERVKVQEVKGGRSLVQRKSKVITWPFVPHEELLGYLLCEAYCHHIN